jgi:hypothetical protein
MSDLTIAGATAAAVALNATTFSAAAAYLGVGDSATAFSSSQTDLQAATNKLRKAVTTATVASNVLSFTATFGTTEGNFTWNEVGVFSASSGGTMLVRKLPGITTKTSAESWTLQIDVTFTPG